MKRHSRRLLRLASALGVVALVAVATACGSSKSSSTPSTTSATNSSSPTTAATSASSSSSLLAAARAVVASITKPSSMVAPAAKLERPAPKGKVLVFMTDTSAGVLSIDQGNAVKQAATVLGWKIKFLTEDGTTAGAQTAFAQALNLHPDGIINMDGLIPSDLTAQLAQAKAQKVPVILGDTDLGVSVIPKSFYPIIGNWGGFPLDHEQWVTIGASLADFSNCHIHLGMVSAESVPTLVAFDHGVEGMLKHFCPTAKYTLLNQQVSDIGVNTPNNVVGAVRADPSINWLCTPTGGVITGVQAALQQAGLKVQISGTNPETENVSAVRSGTQAFWVGVDPGWLGWYDVDTFARYFTGSPQVNEGTGPGDALDPFFILDKSTVPPASDKSVDPYNGVDPASAFAQFESDWLVK
jgi:ABC-type sugar transport system substrate-binding protein